MLQLTGCPLPLPHIDMAIPPQTPISICLKRILNRGALYIDMPQPAYRYAQTYISICPPLAYRYAPKQIFEQWTDAYRYAPEGISICPYAKRENWYFDRNFLIRTPIEVIQV